MIPLPTIVPYVVPAKKPLSNFKPIKEETNMQSYVCELCDYTYDPAKGDPELAAIRPRLGFVGL